MAGIRWETLVERCRVSRERRGRSKERRRVSVERRLGFVERRGRSRERRGGSVGRRRGSVERRGGSAERRGRSITRRGRSGERGEPRREQPRGSRGILWLVRLPPSPSRPSGWIVARGGAVTARRRGGGCGFVRCLADCLATASENSAGPRSCKTGNTQGLSMKMHLPLIGQDILWLIANVRGGMADFRALTVDFPLSKTHFPPPASDFVRRKCHTGTHGACPWPASCNFRQSLMRKQVILRQ